MSSTRQAWLERPPAFTLRKSREGDALHCEGLSLTSLAERFGTPLYVYSATMIRDRMRKFQRAFKPVPHTVCYSVKANSNLSILRLLDGVGCGFDVVSAGELQRVLAVDRKAAQKVVFSGVGKTQQELLAGLRAGIRLFNVESESELDVLSQCAARVRKVAPIALRVNPDVMAETHPYISTGLRQHKFGIPIAEARRLYARAAKERFLRVAGVSVHIGSQIADIEPFALTMKKVAELVRMLRSDGHKVEYVDAGGGLAISYEIPEAGGFEQRVKAYAVALLRPLRGLRVHLLLEPGRCIVGPAGVLVTRVLYRKMNYGKKFVVVDAAMNDLVRPALYGAYHEIAAVRQTGGREIADVVGPVCETGDFFARDREIGTVSEGHLLAVFDAGAYGMALASNYNSRPRAAEVMVEGKTVKVIRRRETMAELMRGEE